ncbi:hypothetical protein ACWGDX_10920 [Streptomyces sp. NPDC055025]
MSAVAVIGIAGASSTAADSSGESRAAEMTPSRWMWLEPADSDSRVNA